MLYTPIIKWLRTRMLLKKIGALWGLLLFSCWLAKPALFNSWLAMFISTLLSLLMITFFRLWDDMADREFDQKHHPERLLVTINARELRTFYAFASILFVLLILLLYNSSSTLTGFLLLTGFMAAVYLLHPPLHPHRPLRNTLVLLKYPAMLILLTGGQLNLRTGLIAGGLYGLLLTYECYDYLTKRHDHTR